MPQMPVKVTCQLSTTDDHCKITFLILKNMCLPCSKDPNEKYPFTDFRRNISFSIVSLQMKLLWMGFH